MLFRYAKNLFSHDAALTVSDANLLVLVCHVINLLAVIQLRSSNWKPAFDLLISLMRYTEDKKNVSPCKYIRFHVIFETSISKLYKEDLN